MIPDSEFDKQYYELLSDTLDLVKSTQLADVMWEDEQEEFAEEIMALLELAYDKGFQQAEHENDGFAGVSGWTNRNPYRKNNPNV